jgi:hypothetical protein
VAGTVMNGRQDPAETDRFFERLQTILVWLNAICAVVIILMGSFLLPYILLRFGYGY